MLIGLWQSRSLRRSTGDRHASVSGVRRLQASEQLRGLLGANARAYAERTFDIDRIGRSFLGIINDVGARGRS